MTKYDANDNCEGCGEHYSTYHYRDCKYSDDVNLNEIWCGDCLTPLDECAHAKEYTK